VSHNDRCEIPDDWYGQAFGALYPIIYAHRTVEAAGPEAAFAAQCLELRPGSRLLDLGCGNGRHLVHLRRETPNVAGLDFSAELLGMARELLGREASLVRGDMRRVPFGGGFDAVTNFFTSFGYFKTNGEDLAVLREVARVLIPGGRFFMDYLNAGRVEKTLVPESNREYKGYAIRERRWIDPDRRRVNKTTEAWLGGRPAGRWHESVRLYAEPDLRGMLEQAGLSVRAVFGSYRGEPAGDEQPRVIVVGEKR